MVKISQLPPDSVPTITDKIATVDVEAPATKQITIQQLITLIFNNVPSGAIPGSIFDYVISGGVWTGDSYASTRNASMTAITVYINSRSVPIGAVTARSFTASKDTYIDVLDNLDGTGTLVYTEVANNAASPALASNSIRIAIIVTGASAIASVAAINQGQETKVLPIASSVPYAVTDSLGNLICGRDPQRTVLGYRQIVANAATSGVSDTATPMQVPFIVPTGRKIKAVANLGAVTNTANTTSNTRLFSGAGVAGTQLQAALWTCPGANFFDSQGLEYEDTITPGFNIITLGIQTPSGTLTISTASNTPAFLRIELA